MHGEKAQWRLMVRKGKGGWHGCVVENVGMCSGRVEEVASMRRGARPRVGVLVERAGNDGIRHFGWRARGYSDSGHHRVPPETAGAVGCHIGGHKQPVGTWGERGQSTVEFAIVMAGFLAVVAALSALWHALGGGLLVEHALAAASHHIHAAAAGAASDIFLY